MAAEIQIKRSGSTFDITQCDTILKEGELFYDLTSNLFYVGDGTSTLAQLFDTVKGVPSLDALGVVIYDESVVSMSFDNANRVAYVVEKTPKYSGDIIIPRKVLHNNFIYTTIGISANAFSYCTNLTSIFIPDGVLYIGDGAFHSCGNLSTIVIPSSVKSIGDNAFRASGLIHATLAEGVVFIGEYAFGDCQKLESINIPEGVSNIGVNAFTYSKLSSISLPNSVTCIGDFAFSYCANLVSINQGFNLNSIGRFAFWGCSSLTTINTSNVTFIGAGAFMDCVSLSYIDVCKVTSINASTFSGCTNLSSFAVVNSLQFIGENAFKGCSSLTHISIPSVSSYIGNQAFMESGLTSIVIPNNVFSIGRYAFKDCKDLSSIEIGGQITSIGYGAFDGCDSLSSIIIHNEYDNIEDSGLNYWGAPQSATKDFLSAPYYAKYAQYASNDTTKGTIEERLTRLGFRCGDATTSPSTQGSTTISTSIVGKLSYNQNDYLLFRQGNYVIGNGTFTLTITTGNTVPARFSNIIGNVAQDFYPKDSNGCQFGILITNTSLANINNCWVTISNNGDVSLSISLYGMQPNSTETITFDVNFGYESNPITA